MSSIRARGTTGFRMGHAVPHHHATKRDSCSTGGFYISPSAGQSIPAGTPFNITWDTSCLDTKAADIYLYAPSGHNPRIHLWENVNFGLGSYQTTLYPQWWNSTASVKLQFAILPSGTPPFLATLPAGPMFQGTYSNSSGVVTQAAVGGAIEQVNNFPAKPSLSKGKVAAAVLMPILIVLALIGAAYIKMSRARGKDERKQYSEALDKRMSTISTNWSSITPAGASAAIRNSMAIGESGRGSSGFSFGAIRPASSAPLEDGGQAGIGSAGFAGRGIDTTTPQMTQLRSGLRNPVNPGERVSRVSFAADTRPSGESRRTQYRDSRVSRTSRAFHTGHVPPLPDRQEASDSDTMSPTQTYGPLTLTAEDIQARMAGKEVPRPSVDEVLPALAMMRTGEPGQSNDDLLIKPQTPTPPLPALPPAAQIHKTSVVGAMPMQTMPGSMMSPDDMLRAYAERRAVVSPPPTGNGPAMPMPAANYNGNGMRVLYSPSTPDSNSSATVVAGTPASAESAYSNLNRKSVAMTVGSRYDDEDAYVGTAA